MNETKPEGCEETGLTFAGRKLYRWPVQALGNVVMCCPATLEGDIEVHDRRVMGEYESPKRYQAIFVDSNNGGSWGETEQKALDGLETLMKRELGRLSKALAWVNTRPCPDCNGGKKIPDPNKGKDVACMRCCESGHEHDDRGVT